MKKLLILLALPIALALSAMPLSSLAVQKAFATPEKEWAQPAVYFAARLRMKCFRYRPAVAILEQALKTWPEGKDVPKAYYWIAFCYERSNANDQAVRWYGLFTQKYPNHMWADQARRRMEAIEAQNL